jgi:hypothetical protein
MIYYAIYMCLYFHNPDVQDSCRVVFPNVLFPHDVCEATLSHSGLHDGVRGTTRQHFLCGETLGIPGKSLVCSSGSEEAKPGQLPPGCKRLPTAPAEFPEDQEPIGTETGQGQ